MRKLLTLLLIYALLIPNSVTAIEVPISLFPLQNYDQNVDSWLDPTHQDYKKPLLSLAYQKERTREFYNHYFSTQKGGTSPWNKEYIQQVLKNADGLSAMLKGIVEKYNNSDKDLNDQGFGENFRPHSSGWIEKITANMNIEQFQTSLSYRASKRAILVQNAPARVLPTLDPHFNHFSYPGSGYPFDNLQMSSIWAGTPLYIVGQTKDKSWSYVMTPELIGWVQSDAIALVDPEFIAIWEQKALKSLAAITKTETSIIDQKTGKFQFKAYVGAIYPYEGKSKSVKTASEEGITILIPVKDAQGVARIRYASLDKDSACKMPLLATSENFAHILKTLQKRPYGWGGSYFYNDCSAELKSLYTPFGIWLPRHSSNQVEAGKMVDKTDASIDERIAYLKEQGKPLTTIVYNSGHVFMYLGTYPNPHSDTKESMVMTYQNLWALKPKDKSRRAVVGGAILIPLLKSFPEDLNLNSQANHQVFQVVDLGMRSESEETPIKFDFRAQQF